MSSKLFLVGIVGGVASGKSAVAKRLAELGAIRISADEIGHALLENDAEIRERVVELFGREIVAADGSLNRAAIASRVFGEEPTLSAGRRSLEAILHPAIRAESERRLKQAADEGVHRIAVLDAPLLIEAGWLPRCREVVFVDTPLEVRRRLAAKRGWSTEELARRESNQVPLVEKRKVATIVIANSGDLPTLHRQVDGLFRDLQDRADSRRRADFH